MKTFKQLELPFNIIDKLTDNQINDYLDLNEWIGLYNQHHGCASIHWDYKNDIQQIHVFSREYFQSANLDENEWTDMWNKFSFFKQTNHILTWEDLSEIEDSIYPMPQYFIFTSF